MLFSNKWEKARGKCSISLFACFLNKIYSIEITQTETDSLFRQPVPIITLTKGHEMDRKDVVDYKRKIKLKYFPPSCS